MEHLVGDTTGLIHLIAAILSLIFGTLALTQKKGTKAHIRMGYVYVVSMGVLIITAFMIYRMFGKWGIFHYMTLVSLVTISLGMIPIWTKRPENNWRYLHFAFMYWSVIGLYAAFAAEALTRIPETPFYDMVGYASFGVVLIGGIIFGINKPKWEALFAAKT